MATRLTRDEVERRLKAIAKAQEPKELNPGAMCYSPAPPPDHWVYVCPACGRRTAYMPTEGSGPTEGPGLPGWPEDVDRRLAVRDFWSFVREVESVLQQARSLPEAEGVSVDESPLCASCEPDAKDRWPMLLVRLSEEEARRVRPSDEDLALLHAFLEGADRYEGSMGREVSLRRSVRTLRRLLLGTGGPKAGRG